MSPRTEPIRPPSPAASVLSRARAALPLLLATLLGPGCALPGATRDACDPVDPVLAGSSFVVVVDPAPGSRVSSPLRVRGCSRTFESNVVWELRARDGQVLASGHSSGGGVSGAAAFSFSAPFSVPNDELGHLKVFEPDASEGEGFPPGRAVVPLVLLSEDAGRELQRKIDR